MLNGLTDHHYVDTVRPNRFEYDFTRIVNKLFKLSQITFAGLNTKNLKFY